MTFFNKKTEVMQIEMTPYGRYLYSIGKFKPHSYEFVDDDVIYKPSGSTESQELIHSRITDNTPKLKINRAFQDETLEPVAMSRIDQKRVLIKKNNQRQSGLYSLGKSSYSSNNSPNFQITMLKGQISNSQITNSNFGSVFIPQIDIDFVIHATLKGTDADPDIDGGMTSAVFDDGSYVDLSFENKIIHLKEFSSFYEKENFEIEVFLSQSSGQLKPLKFNKEYESVVNDMIVESLDVDLGIGSSYDTDDKVGYFFDIEIDSEIPPEDLCKAVQKLNINSQFLDEELICPDQRTDRFEIYATRVTPDDLEDCND